MTNQDGVQLFVFTEQYSYHCLDWVVVVAIPGETMLAGINSMRVSTIVASVSTPMGMLVALMVLLATVVFTNAWMSKTTRRPGPPREGEMVTLAIT
eukprot:scaffold382299_cov45-Prasinocladus_malaysianus.AAC.1